MFLLLILIAITLMGISVSVALKGQQLIAVSLLVASLVTAIGSIILTLG
ncbi:hypothetical protein ACRYI5_02155 [Furfurilactobacillus sp. WILCCON 0119]